MTLKSNCTDGVLVFTNSLHYGGGQTYIIELLKLLLQRNVISQPVLVMSEAGGPMRSHLTNLGILTEPMILPSFTELAELESWVRLLIGRIESHRPRKIILNTLGMWPVALAAIAIGETPVWSIHESFSVDEFVKLTIPNSLLHHNVVTLISEALHRSRLIFEARSTADIVLGHSWESHPHLTIAGYYISDISRVLADPHVTQWPENSRILSVGTMEPRKNQLAAISLIRRLENLNYNPYLTLVGARLDQSYTKAVINDIETLGLDDRVEIVEVTHDLDPWYQSSQFYLSTSDVESMPITVLLAMAHGLICIVPELFGLGELIEDGITGFLYERRNWESAISSIQRAFKLNHSERIQMIIEARKKVAIYMDVDRITSIFQ